MAIYGNTISFGGGGQNDTLPPLLDNFRASKGKHETVALKNIPLGSTFIIGKYKSKPIKWVYFGKGTHSSSTDGNLKVFDKYLLSPKEFDGKNGVSTFAPPPDTGNVEYGKQYCCLGQWLNSDKKGGSWYVVPNTPQQGIFLQYNPSDYVSENGFLYEWSEEEKNLLKDVMTAGDLNSKVTLPRQEDLTTEYFEGATLVLESLTEDFDPYADYNIFWRMQSAYSENEVYIYGYKDKEKHGQKDDSQKGLPSPERENVTAKLHFEPVIHIDENTQFVFNGTDYVLESAAETQPIVISADKMQESRATDLAGAVWVYGDHLPKNVNDGTKTELSRDEIVADSGTIEKSVSWDKSKNFYARQFTYNPKKQYQTMTEGGLTSLNPNEFTNPRKVYEYGSVAPEDKNLIWIQPDGLAKFWNGSEWVAIAGVYAEEEG